ncbi:RtcB family protein [Dinghuibacter silviterrae]|nr:RtcB family protein [Dinghuibacter silviterrae]
MEKNITAADLLSLGYTEGKALGLALQATKTSAGITLDVLTDLLAQPGQFLGHEYLSAVANQLMNDQVPDETISLREAGDGYAIFGEDNIEAGARSQMDIAMRLPVTAGGALMPDAHQGYGLPIGGVLATRNAVIPYGVGVDIGCRMALSIFDIPEAFFTENRARFQRELIAQTSFGAGAGFQGRFKADHAVLERPEFRQTALLKQLQDRAHAQLGSSGGGNHFVEWGIIGFAEDDPALGVVKGRYVALLSHSGSRGLGATIAGHYTRLAKDLCKLPQEAANLAYLGLESEAGQEYWMAMNLAGDYASACHEVIHSKMTVAMGGQLLAKIENHHNFAWKETWNGENVIVHRKGATPAAKGILGIIPGSMTAPGFLVRGKGDVQSIQSASHGAGRQMSRTKAIASISKQDMRALLKANDVTLIGAGLDEAPMAYKNIHQVMAAQTDLVDVVAMFEPKIVRMADDGSKED